MDINSEDDLTNFNNDNIPANEKPIYPTKVDFKKEQYSFFEIKRKIEESKTINLTPEFQREKGIWDYKKKSRLVESVLMGIPLPLFYFAENKEGGGFSVVDGLQRIATFIDYMNDKFELKNLPYLKEYDKKKFSQLPEEAKGKIEDYQIQINVISGKTPEQIKLDIFERINSGGSPLNKQEMRNALYIGKSTRLLKELSEHNSFLEAIPTKIDKKRMRDRYAILRTLAFYIWKNENVFKLNSFQIDIEISSDFDDFLARYMRIINKFGDADIENLKSVFIKAMISANELYDNVAFTRERKQGSPFNMAMFNSLSFLLMNISKIEPNQRDDIKIIINEIFDNADDDFKENIKSSFKGKKVLDMHFNYLKNSLYEKLERFLC